MSSAFGKLRKTIEAMRVRNTRKVLMEREELENMLQEHENLINKINALESDRDVDKGDGIRGTLHGGDFK